MNGDRKLHYHLSLDWLDRALPSNVPLYIHERLAFATPNSRDKQNE